MNGWDAVPAGDLAGGVRVAGRDGHRVEPGAAVRDQVAVAHDEPGPDAPDPPVEALRQAGQVVEGERHGSPGPRGRSATRIDEQLEAGKNLGRIGIAEIVLDSEPPATTSAV